MTLEKLKARLREIEKAIEQVTANYNGLNGARQEIAFLIQECEKSDKNKDEMPSQDEINP